MTSFKAYIALTVALFLCSPLFADIIHDDNYRFGIDLPDTFGVDYNSSEDTYEPYLIAYDGNSLVTLNVYKPQGDNVYSYRQAIKNNPLFGSTYCVTVQPNYPWYNMLRHRRTAVQKSDEEGIFILNLIEFRAKTLFWLRVTCNEKDFEGGQKILNSFSSECSTYSYFRIMNSNLRWYQGTFYVSIIPFLGLLSSHQRKKWLRSGKTDIKAKRNMRWALVSSILVICFAMFCLKDCFSLALIVAGISIIVWAVFFFGQKFLMNFYHGYFS